MLGSRFYCGTFCGLKKFIYVGVRVISGVLLTFWDFRISVIIIVIIIGFMIRGELNYFGF